jgi:tRNA1(Val) A37 N6-methylase TrmN6
MPSTAIRPIEETRRAVTRMLEPYRRSALGQYMTPAPIAEFMASLFSRWPKEVRVLDPGAGVGSLTEAFANQFLKEAPTTASLAVTAFEIEPLLIRYLSEHLAKIEARVTERGHNFTSTVYQRDFIDEVAASARCGDARYTHVILNPPYKKIGTHSDHRRLLRSAGIETVNLYAAFLGLAVALTEPRGEIVAIVPRSFCNGTYFRRFRRWLLERAALTHIHVFESRSTAFREDEVLQENVIVRLERDAEPRAVVVSSSYDSTFRDYNSRTVPFSEVINPTDPEQFIHVPTSESNRSVRLFTHSLSDLGLEVSTGPVVDFRVRDHWVDKPKGSIAPLVYAHHFSGGAFHWPRDHKKPNALRLNDETRKWLMPRGWYVLTKRFTAKEEARRLVAYVLDPGTLPYDLLGFENHLNVFHTRKNGLEPEIAFGLALFLNSTAADQRFRTFSGHTQVNATDLRAMGYPSESELTEFGRWERQQGDLSQDMIDQFVNGYGE